MKVFITGVSSGIGRALSEQLLEAGHEVWGIGRRGDLLENFRQKHSGKFYYSICDVRKDSDISRTVAELKAKNFTPDLVVLNAGIYREDLAGDYDQQAAREIFETNVFGALVWVEQFLPDFQKRGSGQFIAISSLAAFFPDIHSSSYPASKAALSMASRSLNLRYGKTGIKFKAVHFGPIATQIIPRYAHTSASWMVPTPQKASRFIIKAVKSSKQSFQYPWLVSLMVHLTRWLPDRAVHKLKERFRR